MFSKLLVLILLVLVKFPFGICVSECHNFELPNITFWRTLGILRLYQRISSSKGRTNLLNSDKHLMLSPLGKKKCLQHASYQDSIYNLK